MRNNGKRKGAPRENFTDSESVNSLSDCENSQRYIGNFRRVHISDSNLLNVDGDGSRQSRPDPEKTTSSDHAARSQPHHDGDFSKHSSGPIIVGGAITYRTSGPCSLVPCGMSGMSERRNQFCVEYVSDNIIPFFTGCPDWVKPLLYNEYQVEESDRR
jgi:hypothetical protein